MLAVEQLVPETVFRERQQFVDRHLVRRGHGHNVSLLEAGVQADMRAIGDHRRIDPAFSARRVVPNNAAQGISG